MQHILLEVIFWIGAALLLSLMRDLAKQLQLVAAAAAKDPASSGRRRRRRLRRRPLLAFCLSLHCRGRRPLTAAALSFWSYAIRSCGVRQTLQTPQTPCLEKTHQPIHHTTSSRLRSHRWGALVVEVVFVVQQLVEMLLMMVAAFLSLIRDHAKQSGSAAMGEDLQYLTHI